MHEPVAMTERKTGGVWETLKTLVYAVLIALGVRTFLFEPFNIPSGSMKPTLLVGDYLFVSKFSYGYSKFSFPFGLPLFEGRLFGRLPDRGDVVVFKLPSDNKTDYIKRIIGLPGDKIQMIDDVLYINGKAVDEQPAGEFRDEEGGEAVMEPLFRETLPGGATHFIIDLTKTGPLDSTPVYEVPPGHVFAMGDNRDNSLEFAHDPGRLHPGREPHRPRPDPVLLDRRHGPPGRALDLADGDPVEPDFESDPVSGALAATPVPTGHRALEAALGYRFAEPGLLAEALTHASSTGSRGSRRQGALSNQRLEFLGDRVLALIVAGMLIDRYPKEPEGALSKRLAVLVSGETLSAVAQELGVEGALRVAGERGSIGPPSRRMRADACEALIGALYLDGGLDAAAAFVRERWAGRVAAMATPPHDPKMALQEWAQGRGLPLPTYSVAATEGPAHAPVFRVDVAIEGYPPASAEGGSKRAAEQDAARRLLVAIESAGGP